MILERKQRGNRTYLIFFTKKEKNQNSNAQSITIRSRNHPKRHFYPGNFCCFTKNDVFWQKTFVASFNKKKKLPSEDWFCKFLKFFRKLIFTDKYIPSPIFTQHSMWHIFWKFSSITRLSISKPSFTFVILEQFFDLRS